MREAGTTIDHARMAEFHESERGSEYQSEDSPARSGYVDSRAPDNPHVCGMLRGAVTWVTEEVTV